MPVPTINNVSSQDIHTNQPEQDFTESLSENEDLQEPQTDLNAQLTTQSYHEAPNIELNKNMTVCFKTHCDTDRDHDIIIKIVTYCIVYL